MNALMSRINPATQRVLKSLGVNAIATPTIREEGFTSCMPKEDSHSNVTYMVCHYGGRMVSGYNIIKSETYPEGHKPFVRFFGKVPMRCNPRIQHEVTLLPHSVWETPEGELVDVTYKNKDSDSDYREYEYEDEKTLFAVTDKGKTNVSIPMYSFWGTMRENKHTWLPLSEHPMCEPSRFCNWYGFNTKSLIFQIKSEEPTVEPASPLYCNHDINLSNVDKIDEIENARIAA